MAGNTIQRVGTVVAVIVVAVGAGIVAVRRGTDDRPGVGPVSPGSAPSPSSAPAGPPASITVAYPAEGSLFPPEIVAPTFRWKDPSGTAAVWGIDVAFADGSPDLHARSEGPPPAIGEIDRQCVSSSNELPALTGEEAALHCWRPDEATWAEIKRRSVDRPGTVTISGLAGAGRVVSLGRVAIQTSKDPVGAPIFYRDVPLMPGKTEEGVIKPLGANALPLIAWRLRRIDRPDSRLLLTGMYSCANCHSFSNDGKTFGMDLDGPTNNKALYALAPVAPHMSIRQENIISWLAISEQSGVQRGTGLRLGFMSRVSPEGRYVVTTINSQMYVANFTNYRFLQVFYPTRGILAWYDKTTGRMQTLPGADDPRYVHTGAAWSPDGKSLVFSRAQAREAYPEGRKMAQFANDPNETPIQYDLYRMAFNAGQGGPPEPIAGASQNGMSNTFPKVSPDGRWIVFVQCHNGQLMRPDSQLYIVPAQGGQARRMQCNLPRMNSWHSFSPNGRWLVFSSKSPSVYTQMYLTHLDEDGRDSPAILIENATAANRAVNIPEFVNIPPEALQEIEAPVAEQYRYFDKGVALTDKGQFDQAILEYRKALDVDPDYPQAHNNIALILKRQGKPDAAIWHLAQALRVDPDYADAHNNWGLALADMRNFDEAAGHYQEALRLNPKCAEAHYNWAYVLSAKGRFDAAITHYQEALRIKPDFAQAQNNWGVVLERGLGRPREAAEHFRIAVRLMPGYTEARDNLRRVEADLSPNPQTPRP